MQPRPAGRLAFSVLLTGRHRRGMGLRLHGRQRMVVSGRRPCRGGFPYAEHADFPGLVATVREAVVDGRVATVRSTETAERVSTAMGFGVRGDTLFVHYYGETEYRGYLLDFFSLAEGSYLGSVLLPERARSVAIGPDAVYTLQSDPFPVLTAYRMTIREDVAR